MTEQRNLIRREKVKENSIEEAIERLEYIDRTYSCNNYYSIWDLKCIEILLSDYKRVVKENEELNYKLHSKKIALEIYNRYIPKSKLKEIIDRIDYDVKKTKEIISKNTNIYASYRKNDYQIVRLKAMNTKSLDIKKRLQELLENKDVI